jgi:hypothetical protein
MHGFGKSMMTASLLALFAPAISISDGHAAFAPRSPKKMLKAARRARGAPSKRKLHANRLHLSRRTKRRHRRARRAA